MYRLLTNEDQVRVACERLSRRDAIGLDTETTNLHPRHGDLRLVQLSDDTGTDIIDMRYFPLSRGVLTPLKTLLESSTTVKVLHNAKFDFMWLREKAGIEVDTIFDTYLADLMIGAATYGINAYKHGLDDVIMRYLKIDVDKGEQRSDWSGELTESQLEYAAKDPVYLPRLRKILLEKIVQNGLQDIAGIEFRAVPAFAELEIRGFPVDKDKYSGLCDVLYKRKLEAAEKLMMLIRGTIPQKSVQVSLFEEIADKDPYAPNLNSHVQITKAFRALGVPILNEKTELDLIKKYKRLKKPFATTTDKKQIVPLARHFPVLNTLVEYRGAEKMYTSYGENTLEKIDSGRIYSSFWQLKAETGRTSCTDPNLQQMPHGYEFRSCFVAPDGRKLVISDYGQFELRIWAELSQDPVLLKVFRDGLDLHSMTTAGVFGLKYEDIMEDLARADADPTYKLIYKEQRGFGKTLNFSVAYGVTAPAYALKTGRSEKQAEEDLQKFGDTYKVGTTWLDNAGEEGLRTLSSRTKAGRLVAFPKPRSRGEEGGVRRNARNTPMQGLNADVLKIALRGIYDSIKGYDAFLVNEIHDEVHVESAESCSEEVAHIVEREMIAAAKKYITTVPIEAKAKAVDNWSQK
jgi:DNA polymerase-1